MTTVLSLIVDKLKEHLGIDNALDSVADSHFENDLSADSLETLQIFLWAEEEFKIQIPDQDRENIHTARQLEEYVLGRLATKEPPTTPV